MIFIDWISTDTHAFFNESLFATLQLADSKAYWFSPNMAAPGCKNSYGKASSRWFRALSVFAIAWRHRTETIFFLTYDKKYIPLLTLFCRNILVFEHNTTPENTRLTLNTLWQRILLRPLLRLCQYPAQVTILRKLGQKAHYLGSPLKFIPVDAHASHKHGSSFLVPGTRLSAQELLKSSHLIAQARVLIKSGSFNAEEMTRLNSQLQCSEIAFFDFERSRGELIAIIITSSSSIRGSGWFNDAIRFGIPLIIANGMTQKLFEETFPGYPYIDPSTVKSIEELYQRIAAIEAFDRRQFIENHNQAIRSRFFSLPALAPVE